MRRWKSLVLNFQERTFINRQGSPNWANSLAMDITNSDMINLSQLIIAGDTRMLDSGKESLETFNLPSLTCLTIPTGFPLTRFSFQDSQLVDLSVGDSGSSVNFLHLRRFKSLRRLTYRSVHSTGAEFAASTIYLPLIEDLALLGHPPSVLLDSLNVPKLRTLRLVFDWFVYQQGRIPETPLFS